MGYKAIRSKSTKTKGKTYVMSDLHGMYGTYMDVMNRLKKDDHIYILGDVIDRGSEGIKIIQDIMKRSENPKKNPQITFLLGNHEMQFLDCVDILVKYRIKSSELRVILERMRMQAAMNCANATQNPDAYQYYKSEFKKYDELYQMQIAPKGITKYDLGYLRTWIDLNKGGATIWDYIKNVKSSKEKTDIYTFLSEAYVALPQNIKGKDYLFVHAMPPKSVDMIGRMKRTGKGYRYSELSIEDARFMLEERKVETYENAKEFGFTTICGHTPQYGKILEDPEKGFINIDTGCGYKLRRSKLSLYCIDDNTVEYFVPRETTREME